MVTIARFAILILLNVWPTFTVAGTCLRLDAVEQGIPNELISYNGEVQRRIAIVIANNSYDQIDDLRNPINDGNEISYVLRLLSFETYIVLNGTSDDIKDCVTQVAALAAGYDVGIVYYAGHGVQIGSKNFVLGVNASATGEGNGFVEVDNLTTIIQKAWRTAIIILDACRTNPYGSDRPQGLSGSTGRSVVPFPYTGKLKNMTDSTSSGALIAYSTDPDTVASDGEERLSPFAAALAKNLLRSGVTIQEVLAKVTADVLGATGFVQRPWVLSSLDTALRLAGEVTEEHAKSVSSNWASRSLAHLRRGSVDQALADALKGIPLHARVDDRPGFDDARLSLADAYISEVFRIDTNDVSTFLSSKDGRSFAIVRPGSADRQPSVELRNRHDGSLVSELFTYSGNDGYRLGLAPPVLSADGQMLASIIGAGNVGIWDAETGDRIGLLQSAVRNEYASSSPSITLLDLTDDGSRLLVSGGGVDFATLWSTVGGEVVSRFDHSTIVGLLATYGKADSLLTSLSSMDSAGPNDLALFLNDNTIAISILVSSGSGFYRQYLVVLDLIDLKIVTHFEIQDAIYFDSRSFHLFANMQYIIISGYNNRNSNTIIQVYKPSNQYPVWTYGNSEYKMISAPSENLVFCSRWAPRD